MMRCTRWLASFAAAAALHSTGFAQDKKDEPRKAEEAKPAIDPKDVRVGPPPELAELRKAVEDAARKGENVDEIRKQLEALEKALVGKPWVRPKPMEDPPEPRVDPRRNPREDVPRPVPLPGIEPRMAENLQKAQELMLKAAILRAEDPAEAERLMKQARDLLGANGRGLLIPPHIDILPVVPAGRGSRLGVRVEEVPEAMIERFELPEGNGILAAEIVPDSAAEKAGLKAGDVIVEFAGRPVGTDPTRFVRAVQGMKPGEKVDIVYYRKGKKQEAKGVQLADLEQRRDVDAPRVDPLPVPRLPEVTPRLQPVPFPVPPDLNPRGAGKSISVQVQNGKANIEYAEDGVKVSIEGTVADGKVTPTKIAVTEGRKTVDAESIEKLPAEHRDRVKRILEEVKLK